MPKFQDYIGIAAIALLLFSCQQTSSPAIDVANEKVGNNAISYLRSQLNLSPNVAIVVESQKPNPANTNDLCQTVAPTQVGFEIALVAEEMRYILQSNQDASKIEICRSEDAKPETTGKYTGAGYVLRYPAAWKAIDFGLEPSGASTVIFTSSPEVSREIDLAGGNELGRFLQKLQQGQQTHVIVAKQPLVGKAIASDGSENAKDLVKIPFNAEVKGAKSGSKKEFTTAIANSDGKPTIWQVKVLTLESDKFLYTIRYYQPNPKNDPSISVSKDFEQFSNSFALVLAP